MVDAIVEQIRSIGDRLDRAFPPCKLNYLQREAQLVAGAPPGPDVLQVFVAQGVVARQVRPALRKGKQGRPLPACQKERAIGAPWITSARKGVWTIRVPNRVG